MSTKHERPRAEPHRSRSGPAARLAKLEAYKDKADAELANKDVRRAQFRALKAKHETLEADLAVCLGWLGKALAAEPKFDSVMAAVKTLQAENLRLKSEVEDAILGGKAVGL